LGGEHDFFPHYSVLDANSGEDLSDLMSIREHATHVAGLATLGNPEIGILPVRVIPIPENRVENLTPDAMIFAGEEVKTRFSQDAISHVGKGVRLACSHGARVVNLSLGIDFSGLSSESQQKVVATLESGILNSIRNDCANSLLVVAAGNESREVKEVSYSIPVTLEEPNIIGVGALKSQAQSLSAFYSNQGRYVDIFMRGSDVRSSVPVTEEHADLYASLSGTSMATPLISHLAARILLILPQLSPQDLRALILNTAELKELTLEAAPEPQDGEDSVPVSLPARRLGLVASFGNALKAAKSIRDASDLVRNELQQKLLKAPFEHGHSPF
jgi:subtilisin family serine protease